jgi:hypothetical protein
MTRALRRSHLLMWLALGPAAIAVLIVALITRPHAAPQPASPPASGATP